MLVLSDKDDLIPTPVAVGLVQWKLHEIWYFCVLSRCVVSHVRKLGFM